MRSELQSSVRSKKLTPFFTGLFVSILSLRSFDGLSLSGWNAAAFGGVNRDSQVTSQHVGPTRITADSAKSVADGRSRPTPCRGHRGSHHLPSTLSVQESQNNRIKTHVAQQLKLSRKDFLTGGPRLTTLTPITNGCIVPV